MANVNPNYFSKPILYMIDYVIFRKHISIWTILRVMKSYKTSVKINYREGKTVLNMREDRKKN